MKYSEQLNTVMWELKKLHILKRDYNECRICGFKHNLKVHHIYYEPKKMAWEYDDESLITLCDKCHEEIHFDLAKLGGLIAIGILSNKIDLSKILN